VSGSGRRRAGRPEDGRVAVADRDTDDDVARLQPAVRCVASVPPVSRVEGGDVVLRAVPRDARA